MAEKSTSLMKVSVDAASVVLPSFDVSAFTSDGIDFTRFVPSAPVPKAELEKKLDAYLDSLQNEDVAKWYVPRI